MFLLYDLILFLSALVLIPYYLIRGLRQGKVRRGIRQRLGFYAADQLEPLRDKRIFWVHAVSVGETRAAIPLVRALKASYPEAALVVSNVTETGHEIASGIREVDHCLYFPFDLSWVVRRVLRRVQPALIAIVETEIWPNFVRVAEANGIPVVLVNGRISDRSFPRYRLARPLVKPILKRFSALCMQTELDAERIVAMGAPREKVQVTRNLKFDMKAPALSNGQIKELRQQFRISDEVPVWVAGSTHAGEEEAVAEAYRRLLRLERKLVLVLAPRHPERCPAVADMVRNRGLEVRFRSQLKTADGPLRAGEVLIVDSVGELIKFYVLSDLIFVGGSLVPVGGHNVLEGSLVKKPVIFGPYMHNFKEISRLLLEIGGGRRIQDSSELEGAVAEMLEGPKLRLAMGEAGFSLLEKNAGATEQTLGEIRRVLGS